MVLNLTQTEYARIMNLLLLDLEEAEEQFLQTESEYHRERVEDDKKLLLKITKEKYYET